jgi:serine phosphatase RsbU (regulator of sigma subunit)
LDALRKTVYIRSALWLLLLAAAFVALSLLDGGYLLFHSFAELFTASVALVVFSIAWHTRRIASSDYLTFIGMAALPIAIVTILHALAYKGMPVFLGYGVDLPTQLWLIARVLQASAFLIAPLYLTRKLERPAVALTAYCTAAAVLVTMAFAGMLPPAFVEGVGLTPYKIAVEYAVMASTALGAAGLWVNRSSMHPVALRLLLTSMAATIVAELAFTLYTDPMGPANRIGHAAHIMAFVCIYLALVQTSLEAPLTSLFSRLKNRETQLAEAYDYEHEIAETLQDAMAITPRSVAGLEVGHHYLPAPGAGRIGGDFYDIFPLTDGLVGFVIGDVCGKGLKAAGTTLKTRSALRALAIAHEDPETVLEAVNGYLVRELAEESFVTAVYGTIDTATGHTRMAIAGHPDPVICGRADERPPHGSRSQPLGVLEPLGVRQWEITLAPGESLALVTDGIIDAAGATERFGDERLAALLHELSCLDSAEAVASAVVDALRAHAPAGLNDDVAVVALRFSPATA